VGFFLAFVGLEVTPFLAWAWSFVGAGLPAMVVNDNARLLDKRGAFESIAGKPAPTIPRSDAVSCGSWLASDGR
jgi:hypothetical protein